MWKDIPVVIFRFKKIKHFSVFSIFKALSERINTCLVSIGQILPVIHYSSFTLEYLDLTSCILLSAKYILTITLLQISIIYCVIHITYYNHYLLSFTFHKY